MKNVSVIIPVYKAEKYIAATVQSVLNQTYNNLEILIINDGSPDKSREICQRFTDKRIKIISQENSGVAAARNTGISHAKGEYLAFLDADDLWAPTKIAKHVDHLDKFPAVGVSFCRSEFINEAGKSLGIYQITKLKQITPLDILCRTPIGNGSVPVIRRETIEEIACKNHLYGIKENIYFDDDRELHPSEDVECWLRIMMTTKWLIEGIPEALTFYRVNSEGFSAQLVKKLNSWERMLEKARTYVEPELMAELENIAMAYQMRYLARRSVSLQAGLMAVKLVNRALITDWRILLEEPRRTLLTLVAAYSLWLLPQSIYSSMEAMALKSTGAKQKRRILQDQAS